MRNRDRIYRAIEATGWATLSGALVGLAVSIFFGGAVEATKIGAAVGFAVGVALVITSGSRDDA